jgi:hypothetical protein
MPGTAAATGVFGDKVAAPTDDTALVPPVLVVTPLPGDDAPGWAMPVAAIEIRL